MKKTRIPLLVILAATLFASTQYFYPGNPRGLTRPADFTMIAHRGMHVNWDNTAYDHATGCEATHIYEPTHAYIENTLDSIRAAFDAGADMVEIDIRVSKIGEYIQTELPEIDRLFATRQEIKNCAIHYMISFGLAGFGEACKDRAIGMTRQYAKYMWGWPYRFIRKARANGSEVYLVVDNAADIEWATGLPIDGVVTDYIEIVGPAFN